MDLDLPEPLGRYFAAQNAHDVEAMVACFALDARVRDEGQDYRGRDDVRRWKEYTVAKYGISIEPLELRDEDDLTIVTARVAGNFPGSPANLTYSFGLSNDGLIRTLAIH
jgi:ketosteroid isomerase-like protein